MFGFVFCAPFGPQYDHSYAERDGNTAQITIAADMAAKKGMIIMNAAGNTGNSSDESKYTLVPAATLKFGIP